MVLLYDVFICKMGKAASICDLEFRRIGYNVKERILSLAICVLSAIYNAIDVKMGKRTKGNIDLCFINFGSFRIHKVDKLS